MKKKYAIILAGGLGQRMGHALPKQFLPLKKEPILFHTLRTFHFCDPLVELILVLPSQFTKYWEELVQKHQFEIPVQIVNGGGTRFESVYNALKILPFSDALVLIHDGVRPFVTQYLIQKCFEALEQHPAVIPTCSATDSIRIIDELGQNKIYDRNLVQLVQTPQGFQLENLKEAYEFFYKQQNEFQFTDDAMVYESYFKRSIHLIEGEVNNIKITFPKDLKEEHF